MIRVIIGNNLKRNSYNLDPNITLRAALEQAEIDYTVGMTTLDGHPLGPGELDKTFAEFGFTGEAGHDKCFLLNVVKADNASKARRRATEFSMTGVAAIVCVASIVSLFALV